MSEPRPYTERNRNSLRLVLQAAKLEEIGFNRTTEYSTSVDEDGKRHRISIIRYMVKDECSQAKKWQEKLEKKLPPNFFSSRVSRTFARDITDRVTGRPTKYCYIGLEVSAKTPLSKPKREKRFPIRIRVRVRIRVRIGLRGIVKY